MAQDSVRLLEVATFSTERELVEYINGTNELQVEPNSMSPPQQAP